MDISQHTASSAAPEGFLKEGSRHEVFKLGSQNMGVSENQGYLLLGVLIIRILLFKVLYLGPLFSETPTWTSRVCRIMALNRFWAKAPKPESLKPYLDPTRV